MGVFGIVGVVGLVGIVGFVGVVGVVGIIGVVGVVGFAGVTFCLGFTTVSFLGVGVTCATAAPIVNDPITANVKINFFII
ncbi:hypothetical protein E2R66_21175 [Mucilaginibacter psychrotolerans]|uniref:Uncharacterized protein n=1 Tax=Mucilaginibacter psychrotolerans TaxID=1524096 RepID=A0A4Y8S762_9SPHI|nr:hypothetical protein E2R66_21175 [Mucilaginibacter psychrotolerans]